MHILELVSPVICELVDDVTNRLVSDSERLNKGRMCFFARRRDGAMSPASGRSALSAPIAYNDRGRRICDISKHRDTCTAAEGAASVD